MDTAPRLIFLIAFFLCLTANAATAADTIAVLPEKVQKTLKKHSLSGAGLSVYIQKIGDKSPLLAFNSQQTRNPASTIKLLTTLVALEQLTPAYRWYTNVYADGTITGNILNGNLLIKGGGDPYLPLERLWLLVHQLRRSGLDTITGNLVIDQGLFAPIDEHPGAFDKRPTRAYNVTPSALVSNFNITRLTFKSEKKRGRVSVELDPPLPSLKLENRLTLSNRTCGGYQRGIKLDTSKKGVLRLEGKFPKRCKSYSIGRSITDKDAYSADVFRQLWHESGGHWSGNWRHGQANKTMKRLLRFRSLSLAEVSRYINKYSNNLMAKTVFLTLGLEAANAPATPEKSRAAINDWLSSKKLAMPTLYVENGAGLSRKTRITAKDMGRLLLTAWHSPYMPEFIASMSISGQDGTLRKRYRKGALYEKMHMKTGRLNNVVSLAGYYQSPRGDRYVVVLLHNARDVQHGTGHAVQNTLLEWLAKTTK